MKETTLYLHIGTPKTGTTAIQEYLGEHKDYLESKGFCYPELRQINAPLVRNAHFLAYRDFNLDLEKENWNKLAELSQRFDNIILSDEVVFYSGGQSPYFWERVVKKCKELHFNLKVIVYFRRQDEYMLSFYEQIIKIRKSKSFTYHDTAYIEPFFEHELDYYTYTQRIISFIGKENVIVRPYERAQFYDNNPSIVYDFAHIIGLTDFPPASNTFTNDSISDCVLEIKRFLNMVPDFRKVQTVPSNCKMPLLETQEQLKKEGRIKKRTGATPATRNHLLNKYKKSNYKLAKEILGRPDGILFLDTEVNKGDEKNIIPRKDLEYAYSVFLQHIPDHPECGYTVEEMEDICKQAMKAFDNYVPRTFLRDQYHIFKRLKEVKEFKADRLNSYKNTFTQ